MSGASAGAGNDRRHVEVKERLHLRVGRRSVMQPMISIGDA